MIDLWSLSSEIGRTSATRDQVFWGIPHIIPQTLFLAWPWPSASPWQIATASVLEIVDSPSWCDVVYVIWQREYQDIQQIFNHWKEENGKNPFTQQLSCMSYAKPFLKLNKALYLQLSYIFLSLVSVIQLPISIPETDSIGQFYVKIIVQIETKCFLTTFKGLTKVLHSHKSNRSHICLA